MIQYQPNYMIHQTAASSWGAANITGSAVLTGLLMAGLVYSSEPTQLSIDYRDYMIDQQQSTFSQIKNIFTGLYDQCPLDFEATIAHFYSQLLAKQEPLGKEFEKILYDNLWGLYVDY